MLVKEKAKANVVIVAVNNVTFKELQRLVQSSQSNTEQAQLFERLIIYQSGYKMYDKSLGPRIGIDNSLQPRV
jgi:parvulin-like peptidyl-prolyl isomerase